MDLPSVVLCGAQEETLKQHLFTFGCVLLILLPSDFVFTRRVPGRTLGPGEQCLHSLAFSELNPQKVRRANKLCLTVETKQKTQAEVATMDDYF